MAIRKLFTLRSEPKPPERKKHIVGRVSVHDGMAVQEVIDVAELRTPGFKLYAEDISFYQEDGYDGLEMMASYFREETDAEFSVRNKSYKKSLVSYNTWKKKNAKKIAAELERMIEVGKEAAREALRAKEKELAHMHKQVAKLRKKVEGTS